MALTSANVRVGVTGSVYKAPTGTTAPTDTGTALAAGFVDQGYISDGGVSESRSVTSQDIKAWQNGEVVRTVVTDGKVTYSFTLIETTEAVLEAYYGTTATLGATEGSITVAPTTTGGRSSWVFNIVDGTNLLRIYVAEGEITEWGDIQYASGEPIGYQVTVTAYPVAGVVATKFSTALTT